ncbi:MAG TPA: hypothetical protein VEQ85_07995 [Lacipirellulaceae bacterium]|nr:hypothetical protein [Lacipirellulaceae bacterium]
MLRSFVLGIVAAAALAVVAQRGASAAVVSPRNPYRSFNLTGVNYGSLRWEQARRARITGPSARHGMHRRWGR